MRYVTAKHDVSKAVDEGRKGMSKTEKEGRRRAMNKIKNGKEKDELNKKWEGGVRTMSKTKNGKERVSKVENRKNNDQD